jgi:hypothetical protein
MLAPFAKKSNFVALRRCLLQEAAAAAGVYDLTPALSKDRFHKFVDYFTDIFKFLAYPTPTMTLQTTVTRYTRQYSLKSNMDSAADKEERKREVNFLPYAPLSFITGLT